MIRDLYATGLSCLEVGNKLGLTEKVVSTRLKQWGLRRTWSQTKRKYALREDAFSEVNPESLYWAGFLMADGNVWHSRNRQARTSVAVKRDDRVHLGKLAAFVGMPLESIHESLKKPMSKLTIASNRLASDLAEYGVLPQKSFTAYVPDDRDDVLYSTDFWRGVVDGDGSLMIPYAGQCVLALASASPKFRQQFEQFLRYHNLPTGTVSQDINYKIYGVAARPVIRALYLNASVYLERKHQKAMVILNGE